MYEVDSLDTIKPINELPQSSVGDPNPIIIAGEHDVLLTYYLQDTTENYNDSVINNPESIKTGEPIILIRFKECYSHMFGPPNDETISGHPLYKRGLTSYSVCEVQNSSWIRKIEKMNSVHPRHDKERFMQNKRHFIFSFHDSTFECIASGYEFEQREGSVSKIAGTIIDQIR